MFDNEADEAIVRAERRAMNAQRRHFCIREARLIAHFRCISKYSETTPRDVGRSFIIPPELSRKP